MAIAYVASNIEMQYLSLMFAFDEYKDCETFITGLGKFYTTHFFFIGGKVEML